MINRIQLRETISWITLAIAVILLTVSFTFAQTRSVDVNNTNGKVHIKIKSTENGKTVNIDTTFTASDDADIQEIIDRLAGDGDQHVYIKSFKDKDSNDNKNMKHKKIIIDTDKHLSEKDRQKLHENIEESMKDMKKDLEKMEESLQSMHIHINGDKGDDFNFDFDFPDIDIKGMKGQAYSYSFSDDGELDSLDDQDHVIVMGDKDEEAPVLEKTITTKNGHKVFIYKRSENKNSDKENADFDLPGINNIKYFPNPTKGRLTVSFDTKEKRNLTVTVSDENGKEVFNEKLKDFEGIYSHEIDLSTKGSGSYFLKITDGNLSTTRKIIVE